MFSKKPPQLIIISSPSGAGKSTICQMLVSRNSDIKLSISTTTRKPRKSEIEGKHYFFVSPDQFFQMIKNNHFLEYAKVFDNYYGTPRQKVDQQVKNGNLVLFDVDWQGSRQIIQKFDRQKVISFFILPPSMEELHKRLKNRAEDGEDVVMLRMQKAKDEVSHFNEYDYVVVNRDLEETYQRISNLIYNRSQSNEEHNVQSFVQQLLQIKTTIK